MERRENTGDLPTLGTTASRDYHWTRHNVMRIPPATIYAPHDRRQLEALVKEDYRNRLSHHEECGDVHAQR